VREKKKINKKLCTFQEKPARADDAEWPAENLFLKTFSQEVKHNPFVLARRDFST
jgi:hypothetical protein